VPERVIHNTVLNRDTASPGAVQRTNDTPYGVAQYQTEYVGVVQYYRLAYNLIGLASSNG
jgi:hypothetical protein